MEDYNSLSFLQMQHETYKQNVLKSGKKSKYCVMNDVQVDATNEKSKKYKVVKEK